MPRRPKKVKTTVPEGVDPLDLRVHLTLEQAKRLLEEETAKGAARRTKVRIAAGLQGVSCPITVVHGAGEPVRGGHFAGKTRGIFGNRKYRPSTLEVRVGSQWVMENCD